MINFILKTAWRDSRKNRGRLFLFISSIMLGIAALVAINAFNYNVKKDIDAQAATLLGADLESSSRSAFSPALRDTLDALPGELASVRELLSMAYFSKLDESVFVNIKGVQGGFPFYGKLKCEPESAAAQFKAGEGALIGQTLMAQYDLTVGDSIKLGDLSLPIVGGLLSDFGASMASGFAPTVYVNRSNLEKMNLIQPGSLVTTKYYSKFPAEFDADQWKESHMRVFRNGGVRLETIGDRKESMKAAFGGLNHFLNLVALVSLLLGCLGVASSVLIYIRSKVASIAVFRCMGMKGIHAFFIYFIQIIFLGLVASILGAILGSAIQLLLPIMLQDFLPVEINMTISWRAIAEGLLCGFLMTSLFAMIPLVSVRNISPLRTLRASYSEDEMKRDPWKIALYTAIVIFLFLFLALLTNSVLSGLYFTLGLLASFAILFGVSRGVIYLVKRYFPRKWSFVLRQGLANLFRPNNQTQTLLVSIGLGTAVLTTLFITQGLILENINQMDAGNQPNMIIFGIEQGQEKGVKEKLAVKEMPIIQDVPVVTMKLESWNGRTKKEWLADTTSGVESWAANREARVTYRSELDQTETLVEGDFVGIHDPTKDSVFISLDKGFAEALKVSLGDELIFNIQGIRQKTYVSSFRDIDFDNFAARFFIVFPTGVLEEAPRFQVMVTKSPSPRATGELRNAIVRQYPNVSVVDLGMVLQTVSDILNKVSYVIQFMALFSILTGIIVLISSLLLSRLQRVKESVLLRTLGASRKQLNWIITTEYALLGILAALTGVILALIGSYLVATFQLEMDFTIPWLRILGVFVAVVLLVISIGRLNSRDVLRKSPLEVLRREG